MAIFNASGIRNAPVNTPLDPGNYLVVIEKAENIRSRQKGTPAVHLEMSVEAGPEQINGAICAGKKVFWDIWIPESGNGNTAGLGKLKKLRMICGLDPNEENVELEEFVGKMIQVKLKHEEYNGEKKHVVDSCKKYAGSQD
jgi:hypothetical protein